MKLFDSATPPRAASRAGLGTRACYWPGCLPRTMPAGSAWIASADSGTVPAARADLHFDATALSTTPKYAGRPMGEYLMALAASDPDALAASLIVESRLFADRHRRSRTPAIVVPAPPSRCGCDRGSAVTFSLLSPRPSAEEVLAYHRYRRNTSRPPVCACIAELDEIIANHPDRYDAEAELKLRRNRNRESHRADRGLTHRAGHAARRILDGDDHDGCNPRHPTR